MTVASAGFHFNLGDVPTWAAVIFAAVAAVIAYRALRAQHSETARQVAVLERQQADHVDARSSPHPVSPEDVPAETASRLLFYRGMTVENGSRRPIRDIAARLEMATGTAPIEPAKAGTQFPGGVRWDDLSVLPLLRAGGAGSFYFTVPTDEHPNATVLIRFNDDAGLHWQIDHNLHMQKLDRRDW